MGKVATEGSSVFGPAILEETYDVKAGSSLPADLRFNLSHAGTRALLAVSIGRDVGVDIERERPIDVLAVARRYFARDEYRALVALPEDLRVRAFYRVWTRKESYIKARGDGLSASLSSFVVSLDDTGDQLLLSSVDEEPGAWTMVAVPVAAGYAGAVTAQGSGWRLRVLGRD